MWQRDFQTRRSKCVNWNYCIQILHFPSSIVDFKQVNAGWVIINQMRYNRSSHRRCPVRKGVLRNFEKFTGKHLCQSLFFYKDAGLRHQACNFIKKDTLVQEFPCDFWEISRNTYFKRTTPVAASESFVLRSQSPVWMTSNSTKKN